MAPIVDPWRKIKGVYKPFPEIDLNPKNTCLLIIDMQYMDAHKDYGMVKIARENGLNEEMDYYTKRLDFIICNIKKLLNKCREKKYEIIHVKIEALTQDGRDRSKRHKEVAGFHYGKISSLDTEILEELSPLPDEIVIPKTCSGVFHCTNIQQVLLNIGIETLIVVGVCTNDSVDSSVRGATDT